MSRMKRRIMREFTIDELSGVDVPAQKPATVAIMKRAIREDKTMHNIASFETLEQAAEAIRKRERCGGADAMSMARREHPTLYEAHQTIGEVAVQKAQNAMTPQPVAKAVADWRELVDAVQERDGVSRATAMRRARREHPEAFNAYQSS